MKKNILNISFNRSFFYYSLYWLFYLIVFTFYRYLLLTDGAASTQLQGVKAIKIAILSNLVYLSLTIIATHLIINALLPKFFSNGRYLLFSIIVGTMVIVSPVFAYLLMKTIVAPYIFGFSLYYTAYHYISTVMKFAFCLTPLIFYKTSIHLRQNALNHQKTEHDRLNAELKLREAELKLLKGQIHPHFLFNTLNNLYSLSIQKSEKTSEVIIKISDLLNYIIYECNAEKVSLDKELEFIRSYIDLEKLRYDDSLRINVNIDGNIQNKFIAPMILHTFIENSFKHGASKDTGNPWIDIHLTISNNALNFTIANSKLNDDSNQITGIGIENTKKRLQLIYPNRHTVEITNNKKAFNVSLEIQL